MGKSKKNKASKFFKPVKPTKKTLKAELKLVRRIGRFNIVEQIAWRKTAVHFAKEVVWKTYFENFEKQSRKNKKFLKRDE